MLFSSLLSTVLAAASAVASPSPRGVPAAKPATLSPHYQTGKSNTTIKHPVSRSLSTGLNTVWAGPELGYAAGTVHSVSATWVLNAPGVPPGGSSSTWYYLEPSLSLDDGSCASGAGWLEAGVEYVSQGSSVYYYPYIAWCLENTWQPSIAFKTGDVISVTLSATSSTTGFGTIINLTTGQSVTQAIGSTAHPLCQNAAAWIVQTIGGVSDSPYFDVTYKNVLVNGSPPNFGGSGTNWQMDTGGTYPAWSTITSFGGDGSVDVRFVAIEE